MEVDIRGRISAVRQIFEQSTLGNTRMNESNSPGYLVPSTKSALRTADRASLAARGPADLRGRGTAESMFRRALMYRVNSPWGRKHRHECIKLLQHTLALDPRNLTAQTLLGIAYSEERGIEKNEATGMVLLQDAANAGTHTRSLVWHIPFCTEMEFLKTYTRQLNGFANPQKTDSGLRSTS